MAANLEDVPSLDLMHELLRRMKCSSKPDKRLILIGIGILPHALPPRPAVVGSRPLRLLMLLGVTAAPWRHDFSRSADSRFETLVISLRFCVAADENGACGE
jgi:hypothetical protein